MELIGLKIDTAQELYELLSEIPPAMRERLPVLLESETSQVVVDAYEVTETEGCLERGFLIRKKEEDY